MQLSIPGQLILIGASTGGPGQIQKIISALPQMQETSLIIAQHMAKEFIPSFVKRLQEHTPNPLEMADHDKAVTTGHIYICSGCTQIIQTDSIIKFRQNPSDEYAYNPDINLLFNSMTPFIKKFNLLGVILTGIGEDGVEGCKELSDLGARCLTENAQSAIVDGMPGRARERIPAIEVLKMDAIIEAIKEFST